MPKAKATIGDDKSWSPEEEIDKTARAIFGDDEDSVRRWVDYWRRSRSRNAELLEAFRPLTPISFRGKRILDIGCGTGGMGDLISTQGGSYWGGDVHRHVLRLAPRYGSARYLQCNGLQLPFPDRSFDFVFAFDVVEHLVGGWHWQLRFFSQVRRVLKRTGMLLLTTPNFWYPKEGHTGLLGPQFLPRSWADLYISRRNPGFLKEHRTFGEIQLLTPRRLQKGLRSSGLAFLHQLPCGLDRNEYRRLFPLRGLLTRLGLGWYPHAEFWGVCVRKEMRSLQRWKLRSLWNYERQQPSQGETSDFGPLIDFDRAKHNPQLIEGWYWHERDSQGYRWIGPRAVSLLQSVEDCPYLRIKGFAPQANRLHFYVDDIRVGERALAEGEAFDLVYMIPLGDAPDRLFRVEIRCERTFVAEESGDDRRLGAMIFSLGLEETLSD